MRIREARGALEWLEENPNRCIGKTVPNKDNRLETNRRQFIQKILDAGALRVSVVGAFELPGGSGYADCLYVALPEDTRRRINLLIYLANLRSADPHDGNPRFLIETTKNPDVVAVTIV